MDPQMHTDGDVSDRAIARGQGGCSRVSPSTIAAVCICGAVLLASLTPASAARLDDLEQMPIDTFAKLREVEKYQLQVAEKMYLDEKWAVAQAEYEKFLQLYERSVGAPYAQLMWSNCQRNQRKVNTAIRDGYQSVLDYWPDSREAIVASYMIGRSYQDIGEPAKAKKAYAQLIADHPNHVVAVKAKVNLVEIARVEEDNDRRVELWKDLTYNTKRDKENGRYCADAARDLAQHYLNKASFDDALKALETTWKDHELTYRVFEVSRGPIRNLLDQADKKAAGAQLADKVVAYITSQVPADQSDEQAKRRAREYWFWIAEVQAYARRDDQVIKTYEQMVDRFGADDELLDHMAGWFRGHDRRDEARRIYGKFKDQARGQGNIAYMYREERKYDDAIKIYQDLMTTDADRADNYQWAIAECYEDSGKLKEAIQTFRQTDRYPSNYMRMASCQRRLKQYNEALVLYNQVLSDNGTAPQAMLEIGYTYEQAGDKEKAIKGFQRVCKAFPTSGQASRAHAHLQSEYKITITLGGSKDDK
ncbi:MAG: tetratricopeptide repeat protein [Phycisphaera sp.]|nr:tetratricopeptide repeat protein [Phycisphaera sp.]